MNYLGHLFLSGRNAEVMAGNFLTDFLTKKELEDLPDFLLPGVHIHLKIDNFTDNHVAVKSLIESLWESQGKYAPVAIDIIFDYLLYYNWEIYADMEYKAFCQYVYIVLNRFIKYAPERDRVQISSMIESRWLSVYQSVSGLHAVMERMDRRSKFPSYFYKSIKIMEDNFTYFNNQFNIFFPEIIGYIKKELDKVS